MPKINKSSFKKSISSIKTKVTLLCTLFILIAITFNYCFLSSVSKKAITHNTEAAMKDLASAYSTNLVETIRKVNASGYFMMNSNYMNSDTSKKSKANSSNIKKLINMYINTNSSAEEVSITDAKGIVIYSSNSNMVGKDLSKEAYFSKMMSTGVSTESDVFISDRSNNACVTFATPLRSNMGPNTQNEASATTSISSKNKGINQMEQPVEKFTGAITTVVKVSEFRTALSNISVNNYKSGYAFILDTAGNYVYHPDKSLIGSKAKISELSKIVKQVGTGKTPKSKTLTYTYKGKHMYAGFSVNKDNNWILFVTANQSDILSQLNKVTNQSLYISILLIIILSILAYLLTGTITKSIKKITYLVNKTAELDFTENEAFAKLTERKDETGEMSRAIEKMRNTMKNMIIHISEVSDNITISSNSLRNISYSVNEHTSENSATAEELSASMQETVATTEHISSRIEQISHNSKDINEKASYGAQLSTNLMNRALELKEATSAANEKTNKIFIEVKEKTREAIEQSKAVDKINILTKTIQDIAKQTSLLALNASIEAARAGDSGRGFSVVASEIGILADQSAKTVSNITEIVEEVHASVQNLTGSLMQTLTFLEKNVIPDYENFINNSENYNSDSEKMNDTMMNIHNQIDNLNQNVLSISDAITEINSMVNEASKGVIDVADKNSNIVELTTDTQKMADENTKHAADLKEFVDKFNI